MAQGKDKNKKSKLEKFLDKAIAKNLDISRIKKECLTEEWFNENYTTIEKTKLILICPIHGEYLQTISQFLKGKGCRKCSNARNSKKRIISEEFRKFNGKTDKNKIFNQLRNKIKKINYKYNKNYTYNFSQEKFNQFYKNRKTENIEFHCDEHGLFKTSWHKINQESIICPICVQEHKLTHFHDIYKKVEKKLKEKIFKYDYSEFFKLKNKKLSWNTKIKIKCKKCNKDFEQSIINHFKLDQNCPYCTNIKTLKEIKYIISKNINALKKIYPEIFKRIKIKTKINDKWYKKYYHGLGHTKIKFNCKIHGEYEKFIENPTARDENQYLCPQCSANLAESHGERKIRLWLEENNINYIKEYSFPDLVSEDTKKPLRFDFYLPELNTVIEFDGIQHFEPVEIFGGEEAYQKLKRNDELKNRYTSQNNIKLIRINYNMSDSEINDILRKNLKGD